MNREYSILLMTMAQHAEQINLDMFVLENQILVPFLRQAEAPAFR
jgi:hypothetical protein